MNRPTFLHHAVLLSVALLVTACANDGGVRKMAHPSTVVPAEKAMAPADAAQSGNDATSSMPARVKHDAHRTSAGDSTSLVPPKSGSEATQAEQDYNAIYGSTNDQAVDGAVATPKDAIQSFDPWEKLNRHVYAFNMAVDRGILKPVATTYSKIVPQPARNGVNNFFNNLGQPATIVNALLQGKGRLAGQSLERFALNSTVGIVGIFDPAARIKIPNRREDFGQTLGVWGWKRSRYVVLPLFGPSTLRDALGTAVNSRLSPVRYVEDDKARIFLQGLGLIDLRTRLFPLDNLLIGATDEYTLVRDSWVQRRNYQISGSSDTKTEEGASPLPDYLREDVGPAK